MKPKKKILFILPTLMAGGAERVMSYIANNLNSELFQAKLLIIGFEKDAVFEFNAENVIFLNKAKVSKSIFDIFHLLKHDKPDVVISSISHLNVLMAFFSFLFLKIKFIGREASVISSMKRYGSIKFKINYFLIKFSYRFLNAIICQSLDMLNDFVDNIKIDKTKLVLIHNPITRKCSLKHDKVGLSKIKYVTVGRLSEEKGHLRVLEAFSKSKIKNFEYTIVGSGPLEKTLKIEVSNLNLGENVVFISHTNQIFEELQKHDVFIQGSYVEGFPNGLLEAMSIGIPAIAFEAPGGTSEIIIDNINGHVVSNVKELTAMIDEDNLAVKFDKQKVVESVEARFSAEVILNKYENLFLTV